MSSPPVDPTPPNASLDSWTTLDVLYYCYMVGKEGHCVRALCHWACYEFGSAHIWVRLSSTFPCGGRRVALGWCNELHLHTSGRPWLHVMSDQTMSQSRSRVGRGQAAPHGCHLELVAIIPCHAIPRIPFFRLLPLLPVLLIDFTFGFPHVSARICKCPRLTWVAC